MWDCDKVSEEFGYKKFVREYSEDEIRLVLQTELRVLLKVKCLRKHSCEECCWTSPCVYKDWVNEEDIGELIKKVKWIELGIDLENREIGLLKEEEVFGIKRCR